MPESISNLLSIDHELRIYLINTFKSLVVYHCSPRKEFNWKTNDLGSMNVEGLNKKYYVSEDCKLNLIFGFKKA